MHWDEENDEMVRKWNESAPDGEGQPWLVLSLCCFIYQLETVKWAKCQGRCDEAHPSKHWNLSIWPICRNKSASFIPFLQFFFKKIFLILFLMLYYSTFVWIYSVKIKKKIEIKKVKWKFLTFSQSILLKKNENSYMLYTISLIVLVFFIKKIAVKLFTTIENKIFPYIFLQTKQEK